MVLWCPLVLLIWTGNSLGDKSMLLYAIHFTARACTGTTTVFTCGCRHSFTVANTYVGSLRLSVLNKSTTTFFGFLCPTFMVTVSKKRCVCSCNTVISCLMLNKNTTTFFGFLCPTFMVTVSKKRCVCSYDTVIPCLMFTGRESSPVLTVSGTREVSSSLTSFGARESSLVHCFLDEKSVSC